MCKWALLAAALRAAAEAEAGGGGGERGTDPRIVLGVHTLTKGGDANADANADADADAAGSVGGGKVNSEEETDR